MVSTTNSKKKTAKGSSNGSTAINPMIPPKPYTEYTIFFRLERAYLLQTSGVIDEEIISSLDPNHIDELEYPRPVKYSNLTLPPYWYSSRHKAAVEKKRKHRKREGRLDLKTLSKTISASWRNADKEVIEYCRMLARAELATYNELVEAAHASDPSIAIKGMLKKVPKKFQPQQQPQQATTPPPPPMDIPDGTLLSAKDFIIQEASSKEVHQEPISNDGSPPVANPILGAAMNNSTHSIESAGEAFLKMLQLQQLQNAQSLSFTTSMIENNMNPGATSVHNVSTGNSSPSSIRSSSPFVQGSGSSVNSSLSNKRKFARRASAPPAPDLGHNNWRNAGGTNSCSLIKELDQFMFSAVDGSPSTATTVDMMSSSMNDVHKPSASMDDMPPTMNDIMGGTSVNSMDTTPTTNNKMNLFNGTNVFVGEEDPQPAKQPKRQMKQFRRRSTVSSVQDHTAQTNLTSQDLQLMQETFRRGTSAGWQTSLFAGTINNGGNNGTSLLCEGEGDEGYTTSNKLPPTFKMRRRASMSTMPSHVQEINQSFKAELSTMTLPQLQELSASFKAELGSSSRATSATARSSFNDSRLSSSFISVPEWEKEDADALLDMLNGPQD